MKKLIVILPVFLLSCTSTKVVSKKQSSYEKEITNVVVIAELYEELDSFGQTFAEELAAAFVPNGIKHEFIAMKESEPQVFSPMEAAQQTDAEHLLLFQQLSAKERRGYGLSNGSGLFFAGSDRKYIFKASLYEIASGQRVWWAEVTTTGEEYTSQEQEARGMTERLIQKLIEDKLLPSALASKEQPQNF